MILNWSKHLKFPSTPRITPEGINLLQSLLCEPENRLGSKAISSVLRSNSVRMSVYGLAKTTRSVDGADLIKVSPSPFPYMATCSHIIRKAHPWFKGIDWTNIHKVKAPFRPELRDPADTRHFDDDIPAEVSLYRFII